MWAQQLLQRPAPGKRTRVVDAQSVIVHADLDRGGNRVVAVDDCIEERFPQCRLGHRVAFHPVDPVVADARLQVLEEEHFHGLVDLGEEIAGYHVVETHVPVVSEVADLHVRTRHEPLRVAVEQ